MGNIMTKCFLFIALTYISIYTWGHDVEVGGIYYNLSNNTNSAKVTYKGTDSSDFTDEYKGHVSIPSSIIVNNVLYEVTEIGSAAFSNCPSLISVSIPSTIRKIGFEAFSGCSSLDNISIPNSVESVGMCLFTNCSSLSNIILPDSWTYIQSRMFEGCTSLKTLQLPNSLVSIGDAAFMDSGLECVSIPSSVNSLESSVFYRCDRLKDLNFYAQKAPATGKNIFVGSSPTVHVLEAATGYDVDPWDKLTIINDLHIQCEKPTILFKDGKLSFFSATEGATFVSSISSKDVKSYSTPEIQLSGIYEIAVVALADGFSPSEKTIATIDVMGLGEQVLPDTIYVYDDSRSAIKLPSGDVITLTIKDGVIHIEDAPTESTIYVYSLAGEMIEMRKVYEKDTELRLPRNATYIIKTCDKAFKVKI